MMARIMGCVLAFAMVVVGVISLHGTKVSAATEKTKVTATGSLATNVTLSNSDLLGSIAVEDVVSMKVTLTTSSWGGGCIGYDPAGDSGWSQLSYDNAGTWVIEDYDFSNADNGLQLQVWWMDAASPFSYSVEITYNYVEPVTEAPTEPVTEAPTEKVTEAPTEEVTEAPTEEVTEAPTEEVTEAPTEEVTEAPTEDATQEATTITEDVVVPSGEVEADTSTADTNRTGYIFIIGGLALVAVTFMATAKRKIEE